MDWLSRILFPIEWVISWILAIFHEVFTTIGMDPAGGWTWVAAIAGLTVVVRAVLIPLFVYQIKAQRKMQLLQPEMMALQKKYKGKRDQFSRQQMAEEQQALFKKHGTNPFSSCLPIIAQMPIFFSLFRVIRNTEGIAAGTIPPIGGLTQELANQATHASIFGVELSNTFLQGDIETKVLTAIMIIVMGVSQFLTQRQLMTKNMSEAALNNPFMQQQKMLLYIMPIIFAVGGIYFPVGLLVYWLISNFWTMGQQFVVIRNMPTPGSLAEKEMHARRERKGKPSSFPVPAPQGSATSVTEAVRKGGQRQQPMSKARQKKKKK